MPASAEHEAKGKKSNVTIFLRPEVLDAVRAAAVEDNRSLSNYIAGILERAHPLAAASRQVDLEDAIAATVKRGAVRGPRHK